MTRPFLSVVIPTRERHETLGCAIETALMDPMADLEVVVSDNFSSPATQQVVARFADPRLRYVRTDKRLSMCDNWEFALAAASGAYILYIGDDDAVVPGALTRLRQLHGSWPADTYNWPTHIYTWPINGARAEISHLAREGCAVPIDLRATAMSMMRMGGWRHYKIPCMYYSAVARWIPETIAAKTGRVFHTTQPDVFLSAAIPAVARSAMQTGFAVTSHGRSAKSHGGSMVARQGKDVQDLFVSEYGDYHIHRMLYPGVTVKANLIADAILVARDLFPDFYASTSFDYDAMWAYLLRLQRFFKWDLSVREVLAKRAEIRRSHPFHVGRFLAFLALHRGSEMRRAVLESLGGVRRGPRPIPANIGDFVRGLHAQGAAGETLCPS